MFKKRIPSRNALMFMAGGMLLGITSMILQWNSLPESVITRISYPVNTPLNYLIDWIADAFYNGNADQMMWQGVLLWWMYWVALGGGLGLAAHWIYRYVSSRFCMKKADHSS
jgi:hypothetical protein